eukprot:COSAG01_NODE_178_length_22933_cov_18.398529_10_plen_164_part_00
MREQGLLSMGRLLRLAVEQNRRSSAGGSLSAFADGWISALACCLCTAVRRDGEFSEKLSSRRPPYTDSRALSDSAQQRRTQHRVRLKEIQPSAKQSGQAWVSWPAEDKRPMHSAALGASARVRAPPARALPRATPARAPRPASHRSRRALLAPGLRMPTSTGS